MGLFTIVGGLLSVLLALTIGFEKTIWVALCVYGIAFAMMVWLRDVEQAVAVSATPTER